MQSGTGKREVADGVEQLVTGELRLHPQTAGVQDVVVVDHDRVIQAAAQGEAGGLHLFDFRHHREGAGAGEFLAEAGGREGDGGGLPTDGGGGEVDGDIHMQGRRGRPGEGAQFGPGVDIADADGAADFDDAARFVLIDQPGAFQQKQKLPRRTVEDRHFRAVEFDQHVADAETGERGQDVFHGADARGGVVAGQDGAQAGIDDAIEAGGNVAAEIGAAEDDAVIDRRGIQVHVDALAGVQPDADAGDGRFQRALRDDRIGMRPDISADDVLHAVHQTSVPDAAPTEASGAETALRPGAPRGESKIVAQCFPLWARQPVDDARFGALRSVTDTVSVTERARREKMRRARRIPIVNDAAILAPQTRYEAPRMAAKPGETVVTSTCGHNCGGRCVVNAHVVDGRIVHISTDARRWNAEHPPLPACARGVGQIERTYHPDRLRHPMRRVGPRGEGRFEQISWDRALDEIAGEMLRIRATYGNAAILDASRTGTQSMLHGRGAAQRFINMFGGCTDLWSNMSAEAEVFSIRMTYGAKAEYKSSGREPTDYANSRFILMWGWSPGDGTFGTGTMAYLRDAKKQGTHIVCVDPRRTATSKLLADEHIFIRPSTDAAALIAMAHVIVTEGLHDQAYCDRYVLGFDEAHLPDGAPAGASYRSYLLGLTDGTPKTPEWAEAITGIPADTLRTLAIRFATAKPAALQTGYAPGRTAFGEQFHRAAYALAAITGNVGIVGGNSGTSNGATGRSGIKSLPIGRNPIDARVASPLLADLLARGRDGGYPADIRMIYSSGGDLFNQCPNAGKMAASLDKVEFFVAQDHFLTPTARFADIVLPATTSWERNDIHVPWAGAGHYAIFMKQAIAPMYECRDDIDIFADLARRVGIEGYNDKTEMEWLREFATPAVDDFDRFVEQGVARFAPPADAVAFAREIRDPERFPFSTPSGKIEIYSTVLAAKPDYYGLGAMSPIPTWVPPPAPDTRHPLQLCTPKSRARTHSIHGNQPGLARVDPDTVWINTADAAARGIVDGQSVRVFNDIGATVLPATVTDRVLAGVVSIKEGAWFTPNEDGVDSEGCANALTMDRAAPCGATTYNTNQVEVVGVDSARHPDSRRAPL